MPISSHYSRNCRNIPTPFVVLSQPRTGSTLICSLLSSHPGIRALVEPINPIGHSHHMRPIGSKCLVPEDMAQYHLKHVLDILFANQAPPEEWLLSYKNATNAAGFKIMAHQLTALRDEQVFWRYLVDNNVKVILIFRHNIVMQYVSDLIVQKTNQCACWDGDVKTASVVVPIGSLGAQLQRIMAEKRYLTRRVVELGLDKRRLQYEDFKDDINSVNRLVPWLIGEKYTLTTKLLKQNPDSMMSRVKNYNELVCELRRLNLGHLIVNN